MAKRRLTFTDVPEILEAARVAAVARGQTRAEYARTAVRAAIRRDNVKPPAGPKLAEAE